jgi:hypothetical protein
MVMAAIIMYEIDPGLMIRSPDEVKVQEVSNGQVEITARVGNRGYVLGPFDTPLDWTLVWQRIELPVG